MGERVLRLRVRVEEVVEKRVAKERAESSTNPNPAGKAPARVRVKEATQRSRRRTLRFLRAPQKHQLPLHLKRQMHDMLAHEWCMPNLRGELTNQLEPLHSSGAPDLIELF